MLKLLLKIYCSLWVKALFFLVTIISDACFYDDRCTFQSRDGPPKLNMDDGVSGISSKSSPCCRTWVVMLLKLVMISYLKYSLPTRNYSFLCTCPKYSLPSMRNLLCLMDLLRIEEVLDTNALSFL